MKASVYALLGALCCCAPSVYATDLFEAVVVGVERGLMTEPPSNVTDELSGSGAHTINCTMAVGARIGAPGVPTTGDLDDVGYYANVQCARPGGATTVGRTGVSKQIVGLHLCEDPIADTVRACTVIHSATVPAATTSNITVSAYGEYDSDFLVVAPQYYVIAVIRLSNPNTDFYWASTTGVPGDEVNWGSGNKPAWECIEVAANSTYECTIVTPLGFRYLP